MTAVLEVRGLHAGIDGKEILKGVDLTVRQGEIHALMGPNGTGKSTLANVLMGHPSYQVTQGRDPLQGQTSSTGSRTNAPGWACSWPSSIRWRSRA